MFITKKKLLEWATAETIEKSAKEKLGYVYKNMWSNVVLAIFFMALSIILGLNNSNNILMFVIGTFMLIAPYAAYIMSKKVIFDGKNKLTDKEKKEIYERNKQLFTTG